MALARLAFLANRDHPALDAAIDACPARTDRSLYVRWRAIGFLARVRYEDFHSPGQPAASSGGRASGTKGRTRGTPGARDKRPARLLRMVPLCVSAGAAPWGARACGRAAPHRWG